MAVHLLKNLEGKEVVLLSSDDGQLTLSSDDGWMLAVYSKYSLRSKAGGDALLKNDGKATVVATVCSGHEASIRFADGETLVIDLSPSGYLGPEAMQLTGPDNEIIVWN